MPPGVLICNNETYFVAGHCWCDHVFISAKWQDTTNKLMFIEMRDSDMERKMATIPGCFSDSTAF